MTWRDDPITPCYDARTMVRSSLKHALTRVIALTSERWATQRYAHENTLAMMAALLPGVEGFGRLADPQAFVTFVRASLERCSFRIAAIKEAPAGAGEASVRFSTLVQTLREGAVPVPFELATAFAKIGDSYRTRFDPVDKQAWAGDVGLYYAIASVSGRKGRMLWNVVRFGRCTRGLELGTAFGMSSLFLLESMLRHFGDGHLSTVEAFDPQYGLAKAMLANRFGDRVECVRGLIPDVLPEVGQRSGPFDLFFHDAAHTREAYERDFRAIAGHLSPGAIVIFDAIRWEDPRFQQGRADTYAGWRGVVADPRIVQAVEVDDMVGLALVG